MRIVPYGRQFIDNNDIRTVKKSLKNSIITQGEFLGKLEQKFKHFVNSKYSIACSSGTAAIHLSLLGLKLKKEDIVIMPAVNFISSFNMVNSLGANIYLADIDPISGQMTPQNVLECIKKNKIKKVKLIITMYLGGEPRNILNFYKLKKKLKCYLLEDACHALGSEYLFKNKKIKIGSCLHSDICTFSFHPLKSITSGEGGMITTNDKKFFKKMLLARSHGIERSKSHWSYNINDSGYNYRLSELNCSLALSQLKKLNKFIKKREVITKFYNKLFLRLKKNITYILPAKYEKSSNHLYKIKLKKKSIFFKNKLIKFMLKNNVIFQVHYIPIYRFNIGRNFRSLKNFPGAEDYFSTVISIPIHYRLNKKIQIRIYNLLYKFFKNEKNI